MPQLKSDARPRSAPGTRVKAESRASGSASALALTRETGADTLKGRKKRSTSNTVAEPARRAESKHAGAGHECSGASFDTTACRGRLRMKAV